MESCCCLVRTKKAELSCDDAGSATTAAQCFGSLMQLPNPESLQAHLHSLFLESFLGGFLEDFPHGTKRDVSMFWSGVFVPHAPEKEDSFQLLPR